MMIKIHVPFFMLPIVFLCSSAKQATSCFLFPCNLSDDYDQALFENFQEQGRNKCYAHIGVRTVSHACAGVCGLPYPWAVAYRLVLHAYTTSRLSQLQFPSKEAISAPLHTRRASSLHPLLLSVLLHHHHRARPP